MAFDGLGGHRLLLAGMRLGGFWLLAALVALVLLWVLYREERHLVSRRVGLGLLALATLIGIAVGAVVSLGVASLISAMLFNTEPTDPATFAIMVALLIIVAVLAGYIPARRASRVNPMVALRGN